MKCPERWRALGFSFVKDARTAKLMDFLFIAPFLIATGAAYSSLPVNARVACVVAGVIVGLWNGLGILLEDHIK